MKKWCLPPAAAFGAFTHPPSPLPPRLFQSILVPLPPLPKGLTASSAAASPPPSQMLLLPVHLLSFLLFLLLLPISSPVLGFSCFTCNTESDNDDTEPCEEKAVKCPEGLDGVQSCSTLLYFSNRANPGRPHVRKFCTSPGISFGSVLERFPLKTTNGHGFCQSVDRWISQQSRLTSSSSLAAFSKARRTIRRINRFRPPPLPEASPEAEFRLERKKRNRKFDEAISPPAPPQSHSSTLLCICTQPKCNGGDFQDILGRSALGDIGGGGRKAKFEIEEEGEGEIGDKEVPIRRRR